MDQFCDLSLRPGGAFLACLPHRTEPATQLVPRTRQVHQKGEVVPAAAVVGLSCRGPEVATDQGQVECVEQCAVVEEETPLPLLGVAGKLPSRCREVADARLLDAGKHAGKCLTNALQNVAIRRTDRTESGGAVTGEDECVEQTAPAQQHGPPAAGTAQDRHAIGGTGLLVNVLVQHTSRNEHHGGGPPPPDRAPPPPPPPPRPREGAPRPEQGWRRQGAVPGRKTAGARASGTTTSRRDFTLPIQGPPTLQGQRRSPPIR